MRARALGFQLVFGAVFGFKNGAREAPGTLKIKVFVWTVCKKLRFRIFNTDRQTEGQHAPQGLPKWSPKRSAGEISLGNFFRAPPEDNNEFFLGPGPHRERFGSPPGRLQEPSWRPRGPRRPPGAILVPFSEPKRSPGGSFLELFGAPWGSTLVTFALCSLRTRVYVGACPAAPAAKHPRISGSAGARVSAYN